jgi:hypothetical protein
MMPSLRLLRFFAAIPSTRNVSGPFPIASIALRRLPVSPLPGLSTLNSLPRPRSPDQIVHFRPISSIFVRFRPFSSVFVRFRHIFDTPFARASSTCPKTYAKPRHPWTKKHGGPPTPLPAPPDSQPSTLNPQLPRPPANCHPNGGNVTFVTLFVT